MKVAILTRPDYRSPRILAESLKFQLENADVQVDIFFSLSVLTRLIPYSIAKPKMRFHFWLRRRLYNYISDRRLLNVLKAYDAIIISECIPNGFWKDLYQVEKLKDIIKKPLLFYEVYYLNNAPTQVKILRTKGDPLIERYDWHLSVSSVTEISNSSGPWSCIGINLTNSGLKPLPRTEFIALVDFLQPGFEHYQEEQIKVLQDLGIKTIVLKGKYAIEEIRDIYKKVSIFFVQFPEAFGLPIAECLACGVKVFTPKSGWPMAWRLDENPTIHGNGILPDVFYTYQSTADLKQMLLRFRETYDFENTPRSIFDEFIKFYPHYYYGNPNEINKVLSRIKSANFS